MLLSPINKQNLLVSENKDEIAGPNFVESELMSFQNPKNLKIIESESRLPILPLEARRKDF